jgi:hypothetical protein
MIRSGDASQPLNNCNGLNLLFCWRLFILNIYCRSRAGGAVGAIAWGEAARNPRFKKPRTYKPRRGGRYSFCWPSGAGMAFSILPGVALPRCGASPRAIAPSAPPARKRQKQLLGEGGDARQPLNNYSHLSCCACMLGIVIL